MPLFLDYFKGISFKKKRIHIATTGASVDLDKTFWAGLAAVVKIYAYFTGRRVRHMFARPDPLTPIGTIAFYPQTPGPWYNIWQVIRLAGLKPVPDFSKADCVFVFEDKTYSEYDQDFAGGSDAVQINGRIHDISKEHVADIFEEVFGYALRIDPLTYEGQAIQKSNENGTHDGVVITCPLTASELSETCAYQRLVDSTFREDVSEDLRLAYVLGEIALVYHKYKPLDDRFGTHYLSVDVKVAVDIFSEDEIRLITEFCKTMNLDFGSIDVMRDKHDGRIYIVDVNKTCMPVLCLTLKTQIASQQKIADALTRGLLRA